MAPHLGHLLWKVENGHHLDDDDRRYLARLVRARIKRPDPRPERAALRRARVARTVAAYEQEQDCKHEAAVAEAMRIHTVGREYVFDAVAELRASTGTSITFVAGFEHRQVLGHDWKWPKVD